MFTSAKRTSTSVKRTSTSAKRTSTSGEHRFQTLKRILLCQLSATWKGKGWIIHLPSLPHGSADWFTSQINHAESRKCSYIREQYRADKGLAQWRWERKVWPQCLTWFYKQQKEPRSRLIFEALLSVVLNCVFAEVKSVSFYGFEAYYVRFVLSFRMQIAIVSF